MSIIDENYSALLNQIDNYLILVEDNGVIHWKNQKFIKDFGSDFNTINNWTSKFELIFSPEIKIESNFSFVSLNFKYLHPASIHWNVYNHQDNHFWILGQINYPVRISLQSYETLSLIGGIGFAEYNHQKEEFTLNQSVKKIISLYKEEHTATLDEITNKVVTQEREMVKKWFHNINQHDHIDRLEYRIETTEGIRYINSFKTIQKENNDHAYKSIFLFRDSTSSKLNEARFRSIFQFSPLGMILYDIKGDSIHINNAFKKMIDLCESQPEVQVNLFDDPNIPDNYKNQLKNGEFVSFEGPADYYFLQTGPNEDEISFKIFNYTISPVGSEHSPFAGFVAIISDFTERRLMDQEIINTRDLALEADQLKSAFLANMSHEIRTPMNAILGFSELLEYDGYSEEDRSTFIKTINDNGKYLLNLINDIIDFSKIEANQLNLKKESFNLDNLFDNIYALMESLAPEGVEFRIKSNKEKHGLTILSDPNRIRQVLINLINNAFKFTKTGHIEFGYKILEKQKQLEFYVEDTGPGIPKEKQLQIFQRFLQIVDVQKGAGLGLSISQGIVELLGGKIWVESTLGEGTCFYFTLPYNQL